MATVSYCLPPLPFAAFLTLFHARFLSTVFHLPFSAAPSQFRCEQKSNKICEQLHVICTKSARCMCSKVNNNEKLPFCAKYMFNSYATEQCIQQTKRPNILLAIRIIIILHDLHERFMSSRCLYNMLSDRMPSHIDECLRLCLYSIRNNHHNNCIQFGLLLFFSVAPVFLFEIVDLATVLSTFSSISLSLSLFLSTQEKSGLSLCFSFYHLFSSLSLALSRPLALSNPFNFWSSSAESVQSEHISSRY